MGLFSASKLFGMTIRESATDGSDFTNPDADYRRLFLGEDGALHLKDSAGAVTDIAAAGGDVATDAIWDAAGDLAVGSGANTAAKLAKGTAAQGLISTSTGLAWADLLPWHVSIHPTVWTPDATVGTWANSSITGTTDAGLIYPFYSPGSTDQATAGGFTRFRNTSAAQNDAVAWDVILAQGTWDAHFHVRVGPAQGIITLNQDGASQGTVDMYAAAVASSKLSVTGWTVAATGKKRMQILIATKHASSSAYNCSVFAIELRRTA